MAADRSVVVGLDIGTGSTKARAYDSTGRARACAEVSYPLHSPLPHRAEQDPDRILEAATSTLREVSRECDKRGLTIEGVGLSAAMHSLLAVDQSGKPLSDLMIWADNRATDQVARLRARPDALQLYSRTGTPLHPMSPLAKLMWFRDNERETAHNARWISIKEYVVNHFLGAREVDHSIASASGLFDIERLDWCDAALDIAGVRRRQLGDLVPTQHVLRGLRPEVAGRLGLARGTPFVIGAGDGALANLGAGSIDAGQVACSVGTSAAMRVCVGRPTFDPNGRLFCYVLTQDRWVFGGPINNGGSALVWVRDSLWPDLVEANGNEGAFARLDEVAGAVSPGAEGLFFLPYLLGERAPLWDWNARGAFVGLTMKHTRAHMTRAVMEGVLFQIRWVLETMAEQTRVDAGVSATGGFVKSEVWPGLVADVLGREVTFPTDHQSSARGAAILAMRALGMIDALEEAPRAEPSHTRVPGAAAAEVYGDMYQLFLSTYEGLADGFPSVALLQERISKPTHVEKRT